MYVIKAVEIVNIQGRMDIGFDKKTQNCCNTFECNYTTFFLETIKKNYNFLIYNIAISI